MAITTLTQESPGVPSSFTGSVGSLIAVLDFCLAAAGWSKVFSGTNLATYRAATGNRFYLAVDDTVVTHARVRGFESVSAAGVGIVASSLGAFPSDSQSSGGGYIYKSADTATARDWMFISDGTCFHLAWVSGPATYNAMFFGDFVSFKSTDVHNVALFCDTATADLGVKYPALISSTTSVDQTGHYLARSFTRLGGPAGANLCANPVLSNGATAMGKSGVSYPSPIEGAMLLSPVYIVEVNAGIRGVVPGLWSPLHARPMADGTPFDGSGAWSGKSFFLRWLQGTGCAAYETSDTWGT